MIARNIRASLGNIVQRQLALQDLLEGVVAHCLVFIVVGWDVADRDPAVDVPVQDLAADQAVGMAARARPRLARDHDVFRQGHVDPHLDVAEDDP